MSRVLLLSKPLLCDPTVTLNSLRHACGRSISNTIDDKKLSLNSSLAFKSACQEVLRDSVERHLSFTFALNVTAVSSSKVSRISPIICDYDPTCFVAIATGSLQDWKTFCKNAAACEEDLRDIATEIETIFRQERINEFSADQVQIGKVSFRR